MLFIFLVWNIPWICFLAVGLCMLVIYLVSSATIVPMRKFWVFEILVESWEIRYLNVRIYELIYPLLITANSVNNNKEIK